MKKFNYLFSAAAIAAAMLMTSCNKEDNPVTPAQPQYQALFTYDFAAAAAAGENPANFNGNQNNGQGFNEYKQKIRNDYKGYTWATGSVLPEECHVWRRSDRINNNVKDGGLFCPNERSFAIDGLEAGYVVEIFYDATNAAEDAKEIVWFVGNNDENGSAVDATAGEGTPVATATINGVEAKANETKIASGAKIQVNTVTPATKGTGYIVVQVKKGMTITKVVISKKL